MKKLTSTLLSVGVLLLVAKAAVAVEINIETDKNLSGKRIHSNTVSEGKVVINGKVIKGATRKMTAKEKREFERKMKREEKQLENELENMFD